MCAIDLIERTAAPAKMPESSIPDPWLVNEGAFPSPGTPTQKLLYLLNYAVLAPSSHNSQPWMFKIAGDEMELYADRRRALPVSDPHDRGMLVACGAALFNFRTAAAYFGTEPLVTTFPDFENPDLLARVRLGGPVDRSEEIERMFRAIRRRRTNRNPYAGALPSREIIQVLLRAAAEERAHLHFIEDAEHRERLIEMIVEADRIQGLDEKFRRELAAWIHPARRYSRDGIPAYAYLLPSLASYLGPYVVRNVEWANGKAAQDKMLAEASPVIMVLSTHRDNGVSWFESGQALQRVLLEATAHGLATAFLNQPVEVDVMRDELSDIVGESLYPQIVLRIGYADSVLPSLRKPVDAVLFR